MIALYITEFILFCLLVLYPCGALVLRNQSNFLIRTNLGIVVTIIIVYVLSFLKLNFLTIPALFSPLVYLIIKKELKIPKFKIDWLVISIIFLVTLIQGSINFTSGDLVDEGIKLINVHKNDSVWMIALSESVARGVPPINPGYSQAPIQNYHYFLNVFIVVAQAITKIPMITLYLKIISPFLLFMFAGTSYLFIRELTKSRWAGIGGVLLLTLGSNLYYLARLFHPQALLTPSIFWVNEYETHVVNYQLLLSFILIFSWFYLLINKSRSLLLLSLLAGSLIAFKSFALVVLLPSLGVMAIIEIFKRNYFYLKLTLLTTFFTALFYLTANPTFQSQFIFQPFYLIQTMFVTADHINYPEWALKVQTYVSENNIKRVIQFYSEGVLLFIIGNLGLRMMGFWSIFRNSITKLLGLMTFFGIVTSLVLVSKGVAWNSVQFFYYSIVASSVLFVYFLKEISIKHKVLSVILFLITWLSLFPGVLHTTNSYISQVNQKVDNQGIYQAAVLLRDKPKGVVLINPRYINSSFIPAVSNQQAYLANPGMLDVQLIDYSTALKQVKDFFENKSVDIEFINNNHIRYVLTDNEDLRNYEAVGLTLIYSQDGFKIFQNSKEF